MRGVFNLGCGVLVAAGWLYGLLFAPLAAAADEHCQKRPDDCVAIGQWQVSLGVGLGVRTNPLAGGDDIPILLLPQISYYGERLFVDTTTLGFSLLETERQSLALVTTLGLDYMYFNDLSLGNFIIDGGGGNYALNAAPQDQGLNDAAEPPQDNTNTPNTTDKDGPSEFFHKGNATPLESPQSITLDALKPRRLALLGGLEYRVYHKNTGLTLQLLNDVIGVHRAQEVRAGIDQRLYQGENQFTLASGFVWQSDDLVDYYYGLDAEETGQNPELMYRAGDSFTPYLRLDWHRPLSKHWVLQASFQQKWFGSAIKNSPLVDQSGSTTVFVGGVYYF